MPGSGHRRHQFFVRQDEVGRDQVMTATVEFFDRTMMEAMALLAETRRYLIDRSETERKGMPVEYGLAASMESMRLVARLTQVLAWLLTHRAVHAGEMNL